MGMTDKEFKKLSRSELIDIIYEVQSREQQLQERLDKTIRQLTSKEIKIAEAGSIADAVIGLSRIFETAQKAADQYLDQVYANNADIEERCHQMLEGAQQKADDIIRSAEARSKRIKEEADYEIEKKWRFFQQRVDDLLKAHAELSGLIKRD